jgi:LEA14-like dessication related protein
VTATRLIALLSLGLAPLLHTGCASLHGRDPPHVTVAGVEPLEGQGMELRMLVKLRVQNPNDAPIDYNGVALEMNVQGKTLASGVSDAAGSVPRFGETVIEVPVTASALGMLGQAIGMVQRRFNGPISYEMKGKLNGSTFSSVHFTSHGELDLASMGTGTHTNR